MTKQSKRKTTLKVKDLPKQEKQLSKGEQKQVKGGKANFSGTWILSENTNNRES